MKSFIIASGRPFGKGSHEKYHNFHDLVEPKIKTKGQKLHLHLHVLAAPNYKFSRSVSIFKCISHDNCMLQFIIYIYTLHYVQKKII